MAFVASEIYEEKLRTAAPDSSAAFNVQSQGCSQIRAFWRIASASGASADATAAMKAEHSDNGNDWTDVPDGAFRTVSKGVTFPAEQTLVLYPTRKYLRWTTTLTGTTPTATWGLEVAYIS